MTIPSFSEQADDAMSVNRNDADVTEIMKQAQHRFLSPVEIAVIIKKYEGLGIFLSQRPKKPTSGSFFATKRHMVTEFKEDGYNWTLQDAQEKLKVGNSESLQWLYSRGLENENFQRRIYWMIEGEPSDIAIFHYLEMKRSRKRCEREKDISGENPASSIGECDTISQQNTERQDRASDFGNITTESLLKRFENLLSLNYACPHYSDNNIRKLPALYHKIKESLNEDSEEKISSDMVKEKILKEKLHLWLLQKVVDGGDGLTMLDEGGQGVIHFAAALGYNWALKAIVAAGVDINSPDVNGWTAFHWAAYCGRQHTVWYLITLGAVSYPNPRNLLAKPL